VRSKLECAPRIVVTVGDPAGIGPEVVLKALADPGVAGLAQWTIVCDSGVMTDAGAICGIHPESLRQTRILDVHALGPHSTTAFGRLNAKYGVAAVEYVRVATAMCLSDEADAMVTAPLNKEAVTLSGRKFSGHTEYIAELCGSADSRMLLVNEKLSVVHVSTHVALREACRLDTARVFRTIELGHDAMQLLGFSHPRIAACGLNPHAGENGLFGTEDEAFIAPAVQIARAKGFDCTGPLAPDTIFLKASRGAFDLVVAMHHDQGHIPMKLLDFEQTVNVSLGIPIIRTSVDHGTAFDIAGLGEADARNMKAALRLGVQMARGRLGTPGSAPTGKTTSEG
jgi:4-hydroxythreonine-4-phosphate dehydrogenase